MKKTTIANKANRINVKNNQGQYESTYTAANLTIVSDRPLVQGEKCRGTITVSDINYGDSIFRAEATTHREQPDRKYYTLADSPNGSLKLNAKRIRLVLEMPYAATDTGEDIAALFSPESRAMIAKLRKIKDYLTDVHACKIIEAQAEARAEAARERDLEALKGISIE